MAYVTQKHYRQVYKGICKDGDVKGLIAAASALVDVLTHNRIHAMGFENLTNFQRAAVKKACCLIVDYMVQTQSGAHMGADVDSFSLQDMRVHMRRRKLRPWEVAGCGLWAWTTLMQTGLMRRSL